MPFFYQRLNFLAYARSKHLLDIFLRIILILLMNSSFPALADIETPHTIANPSNEISLHPLLFFSTDLNGDSVGDVIWGSRDLILAFDVRSRAILWTNTSSISNIEIISIIEQQQQQPPISLLAANATAFGLIRLRDGYESMTYSIFPEKISLISTGFIDSDANPVIAVATNNGSLMCVGSNRSVQWNRTYAETIHVLEMGDLNSNSVDDIVIATETRISVLEGSNGALLGNWQINSNITHIHLLGNKKSQPSFITLDADGSTTAYSLEQPLQIWSAILYEGADWAGVTPIFPGNRSQDFAVATRDGWISRRNGTSGERVWDRNIAANITGNFIASDLTTADASELLFSIREDDPEKTVNKIIALNGYNGGTLMQAQLHADVALVTSADWNKDALPDIGAASTDGWIFLIDFAKRLPIWEANVALKFILPDSEPANTTVSSAPSISDTKQRSSTPNLPIAEASATLAIICIATVVLFFVAKWLRKH